MCNLLHLCTLQCKLRTAHRNCRTAALQQEHFVLARSQTFLDQAEYCAQARASFPARAHYPSATVKPYVDLTPPPECPSSTAGDVVREFAVATGDFVAVRVPEGLPRRVYDEQGLPQWEADGVTPHLLVAQVDELFEDATVRWSP